MFDFAPISPKIQRIFALTLLLLLVAAPRILRLGEISLNFDEAWSLYGSSGSWSEVMRWLDVSYPPLLLLLMKVLVGWFGSDPLVLRYVFVLIFMLGTAVLYRLVQRESGAPAAFLSVLTYGGVGYLIYASVELRAYGIMLAILPWVWFSASGFRCWASPWKATLFLAVTSALALYTSYLSAVPLAVFFLYVLWMQPRRWKQNLGYLFLAAALCAVLLLPLLGRLEGLLDLRESDSYRREILEPWFQAEAEVFRIWFANGGSYQRNGSWLYFLVLTLSVLGLIWRRRFSRFTTFLLVFSLGLLPILHLLNPLLGIYSHKQYVWILLGVATGLGHGLSMLPKLGRWLALTLLTFILVFLPKPQIRAAHLSGFTNLGASLAWLKGHWYAGDELIIAQAESCLPPTPNPPGKEPIGYWNQLLRVSFPAGISLVEEAKAQRVWVLTSNNTREALRAEMLAAGYIPGEQFLSADCHLRQYEAAPDRVGVLFANGLRYHGAQLLVGGKVQPPGFAPQLHEGETFSLRIWWTVDAPPTQPFQIGLYIRDAQGIELLAEHQPPQRILTPPPANDKWGSLS